MRFRWRLVAAAVLAAAVLLCGCAPQAGEGREAGASLSGDGTDTLYFWYTDEALTNFVGSAAVDFGEREGVNVIPLLVRDGAYLEEAYRASLYSDKMPDVYILSHDSLEKAYLAGLAAEIQDEAGICDQEHFPGTALDAVTYQGRLVGYPLFFETSALLYNETYLAEWAAQMAGEDGGGDGGWIPSTVGDILNIADTFDAPQGVEGVMRWDVTDVLYNYWILGGCMDVGGRCGDDPGELDIYSPEAAACLQAFKELGQTFSIDLEMSDYNDVITDFCQGRLVFAIASTDVLETLEEAEEDGSLGFDYGVALLPQVTEGLPCRSLSVTGAVVVNGYSGHKDLANRFAAYLADECAGSLYARTGKVAANLAADGENGPLQIFKEEYARSAPLPKMMSAGNFWLELESVFTKVWGGADGAQILQELEDRMRDQADASTTPPHRLP